MVVNSQSPEHSKALVLFSGGQDSAACLLWALQKFDYVETLGFNYGQRHAIELSVRQEFLLRFIDEFPDYKPKLGTDKLLNFDLFQQIGDTSLTSQAEIYVMENGLPSTFVPARNLLFFSLAGAYGWRKGIFNYVAGMCETDYSGYPDCRQQTLQSMQDALSRGLDQNCIIHTPLMCLTKAETWNLIAEIEGKKMVDFCIEYTHTCYMGNRDMRFSWGYGCDECPACVLRKKGFEVFQSQIND